MKKKDVVHLIKTKSDEVKINDLSASILEKVDQSKIVSTSEKPIRTVKKPNFLFLSLTGSLATILIFILVLQYFFSTSSPQPLNIDVFDEAIATSAISTVSMLDESAASTTKTTHENTSSLPPILDIFPSLNIVDEVPSLLRYLETMEKILSSDFNYEMIKLDVANDPFSLIMNFTTKDLLDTETIYQISYKQTVVANTQFSLEGHIIVNNQTYPMTASGELDNQNHLVFRVYQDDTNYIETVYEKDNNQENYLIAVYQNNQLVEKVSLDITTNAHLEIKISFIEGTAQGTYQFTKRIDNNQYVLHVNYDIPGQPAETGEIFISIILDASLGYRLWIVPDGLLPFIMIESRLFSGNDVQSNTVF